MMMDADNDDGDDSDSDDDGYGEKSKSLTTTGFTAKVVKHMPSNGFGIRQSTHWP